MSGIARAVVAPRTAHGSLVSIVGRLVVASCVTMSLTACDGGRQNPSTDAHVETVLYSFAGGDDGANPSARLFHADDGSFYVTTVNGGDAASGTVFKVLPSGEQQKLYSFSFGSNPVEGLIQGTDGDLYGTTRNGGAYGRGTAFRITHAGVKTVLHSFGRGDDGAHPIASLIQGGDGSFYGTTYHGGASGKGTVFSITAAGQHAVLHSFAGGEDGANPAAGLIQGSDGDFYGTTYYGGVADKGVVFRMSPAGVVTVLHAFAGGVEGAYPSVELVQGSDGNFYGVTAAGGDGHVGTVFEVTPSGVATVIHSFHGGEDGRDRADGVNPSSRLIQASDGNFYGTTILGGAHGVGTVFRFNPAGVYSVIHSFGASDTGALYPGSALLQGSDGDLYGATHYGGANGLGTIYRISF